MTLMIVFKVSVTSMNNVRAGHSMPQPRSSGNFHDIETIVRKQLILRRQVQFYASYKISREFQKDLYQC
jgi:hypothetical protein